MDVFIVFDIGDDMYKYQIGNIREITDQMI